MWCTAVAGGGAESGPVSPEHACGKLERAAEHVNSWDFIENSHGQTKMQQKEKKMLLCEHSVVAVYSLWWEYC